MPDGAVHIACSHTSFTRPKRKTGRRISQHQKRRQGPWHSLRFARVLVSPFGTRLTSCSLLLRSLIIFLQHHEMDNDRSTSVLFLDSLRTRYARKLLAGAFSFAVDLNISTTSTQHFFFFRHVQTTRLTRFKRVSVNIPIGCKFDPPMEKRVCMWRAFTELPQ